MAHLRKGGDPFSSVKSPEQYSTNAATASARRRRQEYTPDELLLHRARVADRKAKHKALTKLRASAAYKAANAGRRSAMEKETIAELEDSRMAEGISANAVLDIQTASAKRLQDDEDAATRARLTELAAQQASGSSVVSFLNEDEKTAIAHFKNSMIASISRMELRIIRKRLPADATEEERLARKEFLEQLIDPASALLISDEYGDEDHDMEAYGEDEEEDDDDDNDDKDGDEDEEEGSDISIDLEETDDEEDEDMDDV
jgi:hypothetical protein